MTRGSFSRWGEPLVPVTLEGRRTIQAVLDTGFTGTLCLSSRQRGKTRLVPFGRIPTILADGSRIQSPTYLADVTFNGARAWVVVTTTTAADSLVGMDLLRKWDVHINARRRLVEIK